MQIHMNLQFLSLDHGAVLQKTCELNTLTAILDIVDAFNIQIEYLNALMVLKIRLIINVVMYLFIYS